MLFLFVMYLALGISLQGLILGYYKFLERVEKDSWGKEINEEVKGI